MNHRDLQYYQTKVRQLQLQNQHLKTQLSQSFRSRHNTSSQSIYQLKGHNQKLERQAYKYEKTMQNELSHYLLDTSVKADCYYRNRYMQLLGRSKNYYKVYY